MIGSNTRFRLLALDIDGTLLDPTGSLPPGLMRSIREAADRGLQPVLCTGRRYRRALPIARQLGLHVPIVCNSGALVKDPATRQTLWRADFPPDLAGALLQRLREWAEPAVSMLDHDDQGPDFRIPARPTGRILFDEYVDRNDEFAHVDPAWMHEPEPAGHYHIFGIGDRDQMLRLESQFLDAFPGVLRTFVQRSPAYAGTMCELLRADAGKWAGVWHLAELWGIDTHEIVAVGDDMNDIPMLEGAGMGVAMGHAAAPVRAAADLVLPGDNSTDDLARFIDRLSPTG